MKVRFLIFFYFLFFFLFFYKTYFTTIATSNVIRPIKVQYKCFSRKLTKKIYWKQTIISLLKRNIKNTNNCLLHNWSLYCKKSISFLSKNVIVTKVFLFFSFEKQRYCNKIISFLSKNVIIKKYFFLFRS